MLAAMHLNRYNTFCNTFHISVTGDATDFKFGWYVNHSMSQSADDKSTLKGAWPGSRDRF